MSKTKSGGSTRNGRDSAAQRLGPKAFDGQTVTTLVVAVTTPCLPRPTVWSSTAPVRVGAR